MNTRKLEYIKKTHKEIGGTYFKKNTNKKVAEVINDIIESGERVRLFYGDTKTGRDWCVRYNTIGYIKRTRSEIPTPVLLKDSRSFDGTAIREDCIIKITAKKKTIYRHPRYNIHLKIKQVGNFYCLFRNDDLEPVFKSRSRRETGKEEQIYIGNREK